LRNHLDIDLERHKKIFDNAAVDPTKLFFFANEDFFSFFAGKLAFLLHTEKNY